MGRTVLLGLLLAWLVAGPPAAAKDPKRGVSVMPSVSAGSVPITGEYWALIIGIDRYQHVPGLHTAVKDAQAVREVLVRRYGFPRDRIVELVDGVATRRNIEDTFYQLRKKVGKDDSLFIYYAGHGQLDQEDQIGYWVPVDAEAQSPGTFINNALIRDEIGKMKAKHVYLVADSCFSGSLFAADRAMPPLDDKFFLRLYANKSRWGLTSGMNEPVSDAGLEGHSIFAYFFLKLLTENEEPYLVPSHIFDQIAPLISRNADQQPRSEPMQGAGDQGGQFVFRLASVSGGSVPPARPSAPTLSVPPPSAFEGGRQQAAYAARLEEDWATVQSIATQKGMKAAKRLAALDKFLQMYPDDNPDVGEVEALRQQIQQEPIHEAPVRPYVAPQQSGREIEGQDGATMLLIPAGEFMMGSTDGDPDGKPVHRVSLDAFYLDKYEVTNRLFQTFTRETGYETTAEKEGKAYTIDSSGGWKEVSGANWRKPEGGETVFVSNREEHPVVLVSWYDAEAYCRWAGKRLPTEAEFEYANRAGTQTTYWWGDGNPGSRRVTNIGDEAAKRQFSGWTIMAGYDDGYVRTAPVGSFDPNPFGLYDTTGNVYEWTADWYGGDYYERSPSRNPTGPSSGEDRVLRGGSWYDTPRYVRSANRDDDTPTLRIVYYGFRCAKTP